ncbi:ABC transporter G family member 11-like protein [Tanacetum coccineum]
MKPPKPMKPPNNCDSVAISQGGGDNGGYGGGYHLVHKNEISPEPEDVGKCGTEMVDSESLVTKKKSGAYLTWEELGVAVSSTSEREGKDRLKSILSGATGYAKPGEIVAIMGPSGCGKSTLLDSLAGRLASNARHTGRVLINGRKLRLAYGTMAYMTQEQVLTWTLTVKETVYYSAELQLPKSMPRSKKRERADRTIREMGLQDSVNIRIGGWGIKGLSGGQKRRVSICLELLSHPELLLLDEPTSGLDSAASYHVMNRIVKLTRQYGMTVLAAIHQPSSQVFGIFNNLCLLSLGKSIYFGPTFAANQFFAVNGFPCPDLQSPADHYLIIINTDFDEDTLSESIPVDQVINVLAESYKSSEIYMQVQSEIAAICGQEGYALMKKLGTIFYDMGSGFGSLNARISMLMFVSSFLTILAIGGFPSFVEEMKVFQWEDKRAYGVGVDDTKYALQGLYKNEFEGLIFPDYLGGPPTIDGETILNGVLQIEMGYSKWVDLGILFGMVFVYRGILFCTIKTTERVKPIIRAFLLSFAYGN